ncbi:MAG: SusC/RagA family TonB-linked outer membrane protein [Muricauda sp.]|nr:SusC/RagA family TonB-linked outer membrane protein [Allomuricauda sp.]MAU26957.1 SusC/RagA family TonB-linked outer membrane protein [Allomuricauda sp.]MBC29994.1 SusC/RagA family TonB-linked outer membrane protein [Allomuricauda sp.]|tara:strand:- start:92323 stop:95433 length:3111 start_codon:yes stop_codon:yes gene_type:complete
MKITLLKGFVLLGAFLCFGIAKAQTVSGTVSDETGPLPGASVLVKGTTNGTQTDFDGNYTLNDVGSDAVLVFSYIGYKTQEIAVNGQSTINVVMEEDAQALDEVVIIGYGQTTVKDATGSVTAVTSEDFNSGVIASPEQLIQGKAAGVQITQTSGAPGAGVDVRIRGTNSIRSNNDPLFVVDGVPLSGGDTAPSSGNIGVGTAPSSNPLNFLNPSDIESISVLKDASATAIYGSRGANGVVIITTKSGKAAAGGIFEFTSNLGISTPANEYDLLGPDEFLDAVEQFGGDASAQNFGARTDWQDYVTRTVASQNQNLTYSRNYGSGNVRATFGYSKQFGVIEKSDLERITGRLNLSQRFLDDKLTLGFQGTISRVNEQRAPLAGSAGFQGDLLGAAYSANPTWPTNPRFDELGGLLSPAALLTYTQNITNTDRILINGSVEYKITPELSAKINLGYDKSEGETVAVASSEGRNLGRNVFGNGRGSFNTLDLENRLLEATLNYKKDFENSNLDVLVGYSFQDFGTSGRNVEGFGFGTTDLNEMASDLRSTVIATQKLIDGRFQQFGFDPRSPDIVVNRLFPEVTTDRIPGAGIREVRSIAADTFDNLDELQSFFARINYTLADKYIFTGTIRADGSSRFGPENQYGYFPSGAFAWKISEEDFMGDTFSTLKLRLGAGITGNQEGLGYGQFIRRERFAGPSINDGGEFNPPGLTPVTFANPDLKWEETFDVNIGVDYGFNNDRISGSINVYRKETTDLLFNTPAAQPSPQPFFFQNLDATLLNQGIEFDINWEAIQTEDVSFNASFNISYNENELQDFDGQIPAGTIRGQGLSLAFAQILAGGQPLFSYFLREFDGFDSNGLPTFVGGIDNQTFVGEDALPDIISGLSLNLRVKNWDFSTYLTGQFGFSVYNNTRNAFFTAGSIGNARNVTPDVLTSGESNLASAPVSTFFLEKGDFVRLQNATVGYNVPLSRENVLKSLRISATGQNLFLITDYSGLDPEVSVQPGSGDLLNGLPTAGIDYTAFPRPRTVTIGINATF